MADMRITAIRPEAGGGVGAGVAAYFYVQPPSNRRVRILSWELWIKPTTGPPTGIETPMKVSEITLTPGSQTPFTNEVKQDDSLSESFVAGTFYDAGTPSGVTAVGRSWYLDGYDNHVRVNYPKPGGPIVVATRRWGLRFVNPAGNPQIRTHGLIVWEE